MPIEFDFAKLISPIDVTTFVEEYWEKKPLIISRNQPTYFQEIFSTKGLDSVLYFSKPKPPDLRVVQNQKDLYPDLYVKPDGSLNLNQLYKVYSEGHTLIINGLHRFWQPLTVFCNYLQTFFNHHVVANCYLSPPNSKGLMPHFDSHDVFVLQIEGSKNWYVYSATQSTPLVHSYQPIIPEEKLIGEPLHSICLQAGDLLYLPRGFIHHAATDTSSSLHITIGVYPTQWLDLMVKTLTILSMQDDRFRKSLPIGFLKDRVSLKEQFQELLTVVSQKADLDTTLEVILDNFIREIIPLPDGHLSQITNIEAINIDTTVSKRKGMICRVIHQGTSVSIQFPGNTIKGQPHLLESLNYIVEQDEPFQVSSLPGSLSDDGKIVLIQRLVRGGLLQVVY